MTGAGACDGVQGAARPRPRPARALRIQCPHLLRGWRFSTHAREHADARGFDPFAVVAACEAPEMTMTAFDHGPDSWRYVRVNLVAIVNPATRTVITVLLRDHNEWNDDDACAANGVAS